MAMPNVHGRHSMCDIFIYQIELTGLIAWEHVLNMYGLGSFIMLYREGEMVKVIGALK